MGTMVIIIFDESGDTIGAYADRRKSGATEDPVPLIEKAIEFFKELFPKRQLYAIHAFQ